MLSNLHNVSGDDLTAAHRYLNATVAIEPSQAQYRWMRGLVRYRLGERGAALEDVAWLLEHKPETVDLRPGRQAARSDPARTLKAGPDASNATPRVLA